MTLDRHPVELNKVKREKEKSLSWFIGYAIAIIIAICFTVSTIALTAKFIMWLF